MSVMELKAPRRPLTIFTMEIAGTPVLTFSAENRRQADELRRERWLHEELKAMQAGGQPLWDGATKLTIREASESETAAFRARLQRAIDNGDQDAGDDYFISFLVPDAKSGGAGSSEPERG